MLLLCDFRSSCFLSIGQHRQLHTSAVLQLAGIRCNPMPTTFFAQVVAGASIQGPLGMRLSWGRETIQGFQTRMASDGHITPGCSRVNFWLSYDIAVNFNEFHRLKMSFNAMFGYVWWIHSKPRSSRGLASRATWMPCWIA